MAPFILTLDAPTYYYVNRDGGLSCCRLRIYEAPTCVRCRDGSETPVVVVYTMLYGHPDQNAGIVNDAEFIASEVRQLQEWRQRRRNQKRREAAAIEWYEHIPTSPQASDAERFCRVRFNGDAGHGYSDPQWQRVDKFHVERRIGQPLQ